VSFAELGREIPGFTAEKDSGGIGDAVLWLAAKFGWNVYVRRAQHITVGYDVSARDITALARVVLVGQYAARADRRGTLSPLSLLDRGSDRSRAVRHMV
jgi:hypothetical protein